MQRIERLVAQLYTSKTTFKLGPSSFRLLSTEKISDDKQTTLNAQKSIEETQEGSQQIDAQSQNLSSTDKVFKTLADVEKSEYNETPASFVSLLRHSNFMNLGDPEGKIVIGKIFEVVNNDLYIDFGWKFHCVCPKPLKNTSDYVRGAKVRLRVKDLELSTKFLGSTKDITLLEADCILLGLVWSPNKINKDVKTSAAQQQQSEEVKLSQ